MCQEFFQTPCMWYSVVCLACWQRCQADTAPYKPVSCQAKPVGCHNPKRGPCVCNCWSSAFQPISSAIASQPAMLRDFTYLKSDKDNVWGSLVLKDETLFFPTDPHPPEIWFCAWWGTLWTVKLSINTGIMPSNTQSSMKYVWTPFPFFWQGNWNSESNLPKTHSCREGN